MEAKVAGQWYLKKLLSEPLSIRRRYSFQKILKNGNTAVTFWSHLQLKVLYGKQHNWSKFNLKKGQFFEIFTMVDKLKVHLNNVWIRCVQLKLCHLPMQRQRNAQPAGYSTHKSLYITLWNTRIVSTKFRYCIVYFLTRKERFCK